MSATKIITHTMSTKESPEMPYMEKQISPVRINLMPKLNLSAIKQQDSSEEEATNTNHKEAATNQQLIKQTTVNNS